MSTDLPAIEERRPLEDRDRASLRHEDDRLRFMQTGSMLFGVLCALGGLYMRSQGQIDDAIAWGVLVVVMVLCAVGFGRARGRNRSLSSKDVITGVLRKRKRVETMYNAVHAFDIGGVEVIVPTEEYGRFEEGQRIRAERFTGSRRLIRIERAEGPPPPREARDGV